MNNELEFFGTNQKDACLNMVNNLTAIYNSLGGNITLYSSFAAFEASFRNTKHTGIEILYEKLWYTIFCKGDPISVPVMLKRISNGKQKHWGKPDGKNDASLEDTYVGFGHFRYNGTHVCILNEKELQAIRIYLKSSTMDYATTEFKYKNLTITAHLIKSGVDFPDSKSNGLHNKYDVSVTNAETGNKTSFDFYDSTHNYNNAVTEIKGEDLLNAFQCFISDAIAGDYSFEDFCSEFGYDTDSRSAEKVYKECIKSMNKAKNVIDEDLYDFSNELNERLN